MLARHSTVLPAAAVLVAAAATLTGCTSSHHRSAGPITPVTSAAPTTAPPSTASPSPSAPVADVRITTLRTGQTITLPATVGYAITGLPIDASAGYRLRLQLGGADSYSLDLPIDGASGTVRLPRDKMLPGKRNLTFSLVQPGAASTRLPQRAATVTDVTIYGPK